MLTKFPDPQGDPSDLLVGRCATCQTKIEVARRETRRATGPWDDLLMAECPQCKCRIYLIPKPHVIEAKIEDA